MLAKIIQHNL